MRFKVRLLRSTQVVVEIVGMERPNDVLTVEDVGDKVLALEQTMERLTGLRCHVDPFDAPASWPADKVRVELDTGQQIEVPDV